MRIWKPGFLVTGPVVEDDPTYWNGLDWSLTQKHAKIFSREEVFSTPLPEGSGAVIEINDKGEPIGFHALTPPPREAMQIFEKWG